MRISASMVAASSQLVSAPFEQKPGPPGLATRIVKKAVTLWTVAPLYADLAQARVARLARAIQRPARPARPTPAAAGDDLAALLAQAGAPTELQRRLSESYPGPGAWDPSGRQPREREACLAALRSVVDEHFIAQLGELLQGLHQAGVCAGDVGYGDFAMRDGNPALLSGGQAYPRSSMRFVAERARDRDRFNFLFGTELLSEQVFRSRIAALAERRADFFYAPVYHGCGYGIGPIANIEAGSGKWRFIRRHLPDLRGKRVLDLGTNNATMPLQMLRAGARSVTAYELDAVFADFARLNHRWFEFVDNRSYDLELVERPMRCALERDLSGYDIATSFCSLYYEPPEIMARLTRALSGAVEYFVVQANENQQQHSGELARLASLEFLSRLLAENGFAEQRVVQYSYYDRPLVIGRADRLAHR